MDQSVDLSVVGFKNHEAYLDSFLSKNDVKYLCAMSVARDIVKLGFRSTQVPYDEKEFLKRTDLAMHELRPKITGLQPFSRFMSPQCTDPVLLQFKSREVPIFSKELSTIVFVTSTNKDGAEVSGYLDLGMSWQNALRNSFKHTDWKGIFEGRSKLKPTSQHLSFRNSRSNLVQFSDSDNFKVVHDNTYGLMFMHKGDHKLVPVGGVWNNFSRNATRTMTYSPKQGTVVFYDHIVRKKV